MNFVNLTVFMAKFSNNDLIALLEKIKAREASDAELAQLLEWIESDKDDAITRQILSFHSAEPLPVPEKLEPYDEAYWQQVLANVREWPPADLNIEPAVSATVQKMNTLRNWGWAAAVIIIITGAGLWIGFNNKERKEQIVKQERVIAPGKSGAILTLANGSGLILDSMENGLIASQDGARVLLKDGDLAYETNKVASHSLYNTVSTPKGRHFHLTLPDGSGVWLNAASSIRFQTTFPGNERRVEITGEVYFEVVKNTRKPFIAVLQDKTAIEVLGTHFNVNAYRNEDASSVTLLEGKVTVSKGDKASVLTPGQQAIVSYEASDEIKLNREIDAEKVMAWKNGFFNFDGMKLREAMKQIERWYDINIIYEKGVTDVTLFGELTRNISLQDLLKALGYTGIKAKIEGNNLLIMK